MKHFNSATVDPTKLDDWESYYLYNGLDTTLTHEVFSALQNEAVTTTYAPHVYDFSRSLLGPVMTMMRRGVLVDWEAAVAAVEAPGGLDDRLRFLHSTLDEFAMVVWGKKLNPNSYPQMKQFFYTELAIPPITSSKKGQVKVSIDRDALENIAKNYVRGRPFANLILRIRDLAKQRDTLTKGLDDDQRWRCSFNIGGTETGRFSSSSSPFRTGSNLQNIDPSLRNIFIADKGYRLAYVDLQAAEARAVAYLSGDEAYIEAVESSDCHTLVASLVFSIPAERKEAEKLFYREFSYRDMAKRGSHGSNYFGTPQTMARHLKIETSVMERFQDAYFKRFPGIRRWHERVAQDLQSTGLLATPTGRVRHFWSRLRDDATLREAIAFVPQSLIADILNRGLLQLWLDLEPRVQCLAQVHDAVLLQIPDDDSFDTTLKEVQQRLTITLPITDINGITRDMMIPCDAEVGYNWGKYVPRPCDPGYDPEKHKVPNPNGLKKWSPR